jgi:hypothetical protein
MQFSFRMLLAVIAAAGIGAALWTAKPSRLLICPPETKA